MAHTLFEGLAGVSLDGDSNGLGSSEVRFDDVNVPTIITENITLDEEDVFQCGRCRKQFSSLPMFMRHKQEHAASAVCDSLVSLQDKTSGLEVDPGGGETYDALSQLEHADLVSDADGVGQSIILSDADILFSIEHPVTDSQMLPTLEASTVREVTAWDAVDEAVQLKLVGSVEDNVCLMDTPTSQAFEDALCATQQVGLDTTALTQQLETQLQMVKAPKLACGYCAKPFGKKFDLEQHIRSHTGEKPFQCVVCGRAFSQKSNVKKHMLTHKVWPKGRARTLPLEPIQALVDDELPVEPEVDDPDEQNKQMKVVVDSSYVCQYCNRVFGSYFELKTHMKDHAQEKVYRCIQKHCNHTFSDLTAFLEHTRCHEASSQYRCHSCGKAFNSLAALGTHHYAHSGPLGLSKPCSKQKPRDFPCSKCKSRFATPEGLDHHLSTSNHKFDCNFCKKVFACERYLRRHLQTHSSLNELYSCEVCGKGFRTEHYLRMHRVTHSNDKPFQCGECSASFNRKDKLARHQLSHENLKKFKCPFKTQGCNKEFNRQDKLKQHILTHANGRYGKTRGRAHTKVSETEKLEVSPQTCPNCSAKLRRKQQQVCHKCHSPIQWGIKTAESEASQRGMRSRRRKPVKKVVQVEEEASTAQEQDAHDTIGLSTIEIIVVPMSEGSEQVIDEQIQLNYEPAEANEITHNSLLVNSYTEQQHTMFDIEEASKVTSDFPSMLVVQDGVTLHHINPE